MVRNAGWIALVTLVWGYAWVTMKVGLADVPPFLFSAMRLGIVAVLLLLLQLAMRKPLLPAKRVECSERLARVHGNDLAGHRFLL
ncbi:EamA family transporter [Cohnella nanjingensis]|uniref:EamA family transporter n=1 Tax=Cohnella nanjingensis TaxID=1387779 RepID=A0A7X0RWU8_9BACL|nr:EamA family transporter [Cohnella nanjingensis]MBB6675132.1 EamA family transporter [Cohnella nanjingensis]